MIKLQLIILVFIENFPAQQKVTQFALFCHSPSKQHLRHHNRSNQIFKQCLRCVVIII